MEAVNLCTDMIHECDRIISLVINDDFSVVEQNQFKELSLMLIKLKKFNRDNYSRLDEQRKKVDKYKEKVDQKRLRLDNLHYQIEHLQREIRICNDIDTPHLVKVGADLKQCEGKHATLCLFESAKVIGDTTFINMEEQQQFYVNTLNEESLAREALKDILLEKQRIQQGNAERLKKKRKFLEEMPVRVIAVKTIAGSLQSMVSDMFE